MEFEAVDRSLKNRAKTAAWELTLETGTVITTLLFSRYEVEESPLRSSPIVRVIIETLPNCLKRMPVQQFQLRRSSLQ